MTAGIATAALKAAAIYAAILIIMGFVLTALVIVQRRSKLVGIGDGGDRDLARAIRVHGNFIEHMAPAFAVLILLPLMGAGVALVHGIGLAIVLGRVLHAIGLRGSAGTSMGRVSGMVITQSALLVAAITLISLAL